MSHAVAGVRCRVERGGDGDPGRKSTEFLRDGWDRVRGNEVLRCGGVLLLLLFHEVGGVVRASVSRHGGARRARVDWRSGAALQFLMWRGKMVKRC